MGQGSASISHWSDFPVRCCNLSQNFATFPQNVATFPKMLQPVPNVRNIFENVGTNVGVSQNVATFLKLLQPFPKCCIFALEPETFPKMLQPFPKLWSPTCILKKIKKVTLYSNASLQGRH